MPRVVKSIEHIIQRSIESCCQSCIAMVCGISWDAAVKLVGHKDTMNISEVICAIHKFYRYPICSKVTVWNKQNPLPEFALLVTATKGRKGKMYRHLVVKNGDFIFDPTWKRTSPWCMSRDRLPFVIYQFVEIFL